MSSAKEALTPQNTAKAINNDPSKSGNGLDPSANTQTNTITASANPNATANTASINKALSTTSTNIYPEDEDEENGDDDDDNNNNYNNNDDDDEDIGHHRKDSVTTANSKDSHKSKKRRKVGAACVYCRRSHMNCDNSRPCKRCVKRNIGHLCHDNPVKPAKSIAIPNPNTAISVSSLNASNSNNMNQMIDPSKSGQQIYTNFLPSSSTALNQQPFFYSEHAGSEFNSLTEFLSMIDDNDMMDSINLTNDPMLQKLEATNYINGFTNSSANLPSMLNSKSSNDLADLHDPSGANINDASNSNLSKLDQNQINYIQQQLNAQQQKILQQNQFLQQKQNDVQNQIQYQNSLNNYTNQQQLQRQNIQQPQRIQQQQQQQLQQIQQPHLIQTQQSQHYDNTSYPQSAYKTPNQQHANIFPQTSPSTQKTSQTPHISDAARDKFFLTAADPTTEISPEERLKQVINAKLEAGLLKPYNYAKGYQRLQTYMDKYMATSSRARILKPLSTFRPGFRAIAKTLKDIDLILVEESFERMLLDYDRVFTSMAIPACLWRRTGEIYRGNKEFASLVEVSIEDLKNGNLTIYELMTEESSVNFWEKYGSIAFDKTQKAVLTSCNLRTKDGRKKKNCCFSFTIRRDRYNIPSCIVGNFIPIR